MEVQRGQNPEWKNSASFIFDDSSDRNLPEQEKEINKISSARCAVSTESITNIPRKRNTSQ